MSRRAALALVACLAFVLVPVGAAHAQGLIGGWGSIAKDDDPIPGRFGDLKDVAADPRGYVYVLDELSTAGRVQKFTATGRLVRQFGIPADEDDRDDTEEIVGAINQPEALTVGPDRNIYVAEGGDRTRISVWSPLGKYLRSFGSGGSGDGQFSSPGALYFDGRGNLGVADDGNDRIAVFGPNGNWVSGVGEGLFQGPYGIAALGSTLYVADGDRVWLIPGSGNPTTFGGPTETSDGLFSSTAAVAASGNTVYVADDRLSRVLAFNSAGGFLRQIGQSPGSLPGQFVEPNALAVDCRGTLYVADSGNNRIQRFGPAGAAPCGDVKNDKEERLVIKLGGKRSLRFREAFAVTPVVSCDRPCRGRLSGRITIRGRRKPILLTSEPVTRVFPGRAVTNIAPTERGTDIVVAALERRWRMQASIKLVVRDLTGRKVVRKRSYRLR